VAAAAAAYHIANAEKRAATDAAYRAANPERGPAASAAWRKANPEKKREHDHRRRVRLLGGFVEKVDIAVLVERDGGYCGICHKRVKPAERSIDHVLPISKGGAHSYANIRLAHLHCNVKRGNRGVAQLRMVGS
jgi:5-methylcytosine-specific restriction endonuclease McrA